MSLTPNRSRRLATVALVAVVAVSCGGDDTAEPTAEAATTEAPAGEASATDAPAEATPAGSGIQVTAVDFSTGMATITNVGSEPYDLTGHWICNRPEYAELSGETIEAGASTEVGFGGFDAGVGEVAVYTSRDFASSEAIVAYVSWGSGGGRLSVAEEAGIWSGDPVMPSGDVITLTGDPTSASGWVG